MAVNPSTKKPPSRTTVQVRFCHSDRDHDDDGFLEKDEVDFRDIAPSSPDTATFSSSIRTSFGSTRASSLTSPQRMGVRDCISSRHGSISEPRPTIVVDLYGSSASMSALPESLSFSISYDGRWITAWSSARVYLLDAQELPQIKGRSFQLQHRVTYADTVRNGKLMAILSRRCQVEVLRVDPSNAAEPAAIIRSVVLSDESNCVTLSPDGALLAAGSANGIELISLKDTPPSWPDRRTVACDGMDSLAFATDSKSLIATSYIGSRKLTTLFTVARDFNPDCVNIDTARAANPLPNHLTWIREVLFPETTPGAQQASHLQTCSSGAVNYLFSFNYDKSSWGIYDMVQKKHVSTKTPITLPSDCTERAQTDEALPAISNSVPYAAVAMANAYRSFVWFYPLPDDLNEDQWSYGNSLGSRPPPAGPAFSRAIPKSETSVPMNITSLKWVEPSSDDHTWRRVVAVGHLRSQTTPIADMGPGIDSPIGKIVVIDLHKSETQGSVSSSETLSINIDDSMSAQVIPQKELAFDREVELARRRTLAPSGPHERGRRARASINEASLRRARTSMTVAPQVGARSQSVTGFVTEDNDGDSVLAADEARAAFEEPYANTQPRSQATLHRASTIAAVAPANRRHLLALPHRPLPVNPSNGQPDPPHESDADNWVPPPPPYTQHREDQLVASSTTRPERRTRDLVTNRRGPNQTSDQHLREVPTSRRSATQRARGTFNIPRRPIGGRSASETRSPQLSPSSIAHVPGVLDVSSFVQPSPDGPRATYHPGRGTAIAIDTNVAAAPVMQATYTPASDVAVPAFDVPGNRQSMPVFNSLPSSEQFEALGRAREETPLHRPPTSYTTRTMTSSPTQIQPPPRRRSRRNHGARTRENRHTAPPAADAPASESSRQSYERAWANLLNNPSSPPPRAPTASPRPPRRTVSNMSEPSAFQEMSRRIAQTPPRAQTDGVTERNEARSGTTQGRGVRKVAEKMQRGSRGGSGGKAKKFFTCVVM